MNENKLFQDLQYPAYLCKFTRDMVDTIEFRQTRMIDSIKTKFLQSELSFDSNF